MLEVNATIRIPDTELAWSFARSGGPGGQNVNKVSSKAMLRWDMAGSPSIPDDVKDRLRTLCRRRITLEGDLLITAQEFRDQDRNRQACLEKLRDLVLEALARPKPRKATRPTRGSQRRRLEGKRHRAQVKGGRRVEGED
ncbi:MAG: aminoacyl-tRNA hydrolase [Gemmataceae bacterium]|nr:aminoacyl-tRNA hydrolase [Gemmataceae bacterium]